MSKMSYAITQHVHWLLAPSQGVEGQSYEKLYDDSDEPMRPADTEVIPEKRDYKSVPDQSWKLW